MQGIGPDSPAVVGALGAVEEGMRALGVQLVPGQVVMDRQPQRGIGSVPAL